MAVDNDTSSLYTSSDVSCIRENDDYKNHVSHKTCKSSYYICLGVLMHTIHKQIQNKCIQNDDLYLVGSKYVKKLHKWICQCKYDQTSTNEFFMSFIVSVALFAMGIKLTNELAAWKLI